MVEKGYPTPARGTTGFRAEAELGDVWGDQGDGLACSHERRHVPIPLQKTRKSVPASMPWIPWDSPVELRPRERAARPGSLREGTRSTGTPG